MDLKEIEQFLDENTPAFLATLGTCKGYFKKNM